MFTVTACGGGGGDSSPAEAPGAPTGVTAVAGAGQARVSWDNVAGATSYNLYFSQTPGVTKSTGIIIENVTSPKVVTPLNNGTTYFFVVTAVNGAGESAESGQVSAALAPNPPPPAPTGVTAGASSGQVTINWDNATGATSHNLYYSQTPGVTIVNGTPLPGVTSPCVVSPLTNGTQHYFVVTAVNANGESVVSSEVSAVPTGAPTAVTAAPGSGQATINWSAVTGATSYNIYYSTTSPVSKATGTKVDNVTSPSVITPLSNGTNYHFVVTAVNSSGESENSTEVSATPVPDPPPPVPTGVTAAPGYGQAAVSWSAVTGATSYNIYYSTTSPVSKATGTKVAGVTSPGIVTGLTIGTRHFFVVTSENADAESGISSEVSAIISAEYIAVGDSITFGSNDDIPGDGIGYEPILAGLLAIYGCERRGGRRLRRRRRSLHFRHVVEIPVRKLLSRLVRDERCRYVLWRADPERHGVAPRERGVQRVLQGLYAKDPLGHQGGGEDTILGESSIYSATSVQRYDHPGIQCGDR